MSYAGIPATVDEAATTARNPPSSSLDLYRNFIRLARRMIE
jgi:hypothetical protein